MEKKLLVEKIKQVLEDYNICAERLAYNANVSNMVLSRLMNTGCKPLESTKRKILKALENPLVKQPEEKTEREKRFDKLKVYIHKKFGENWDENCYIRSQEASQLFKGHDFQLLLSTISEFPVWQDDNQIGVLV